MSDELEQQADEKLSMTDLTRSLTGYEEDEIEERFGHPVGILLDHRLTKAGRAFVYVVERRAGKKPSDAYKTAMSMRLVDVNDRFLDDDEDADDFDPNDPDTERGKDDSPAE